MSDGAASDAILLASLRDIRLPPSAEGGLAADLLVSAGLAALVVLAILWLFSARRPAVTVETLAQSLEKIDRLPTEQRRIALLRLLQAKVPDRYAAISQQLYKPDAINVSALEAEVNRLV